MCDRGDIVLLPFPFTDLTNNRVRPAIIVSNDILNKTDDCLFAQITSQLKDDEFSFRLNDVDLSNSLREESEVRTHKLFTLNKRLILKTISILTKNKQEELENKIKNLL